MSALNILPLLLSLTAFGLAIFALALAHSADQQAWDNLHRLNFPSPRVAADTALLAAAITGAESLHVAQRTADAVCEHLGQPGCGYNPTTLFAFAQHVIAIQNTKYRRLLEEGGLDALKAAGYHP